MDRATALRTVTHDVIDEHAAATNRLHTGRPTSGTVVYPSIGSIVSKEVGDPGGSMPNYVAINSRVHGAGFLGPKHQPLLITDANRGGGCLGFAHHASVSRRIAALNTWPTAIRPASGRCWC